MTSPFNEDRSDLTEEGAESTHASSFDPADAPSNPDLVGPGEDDEDLEDEDIDDDDDLDEDDDLLEDLGPDENRFGAD